MCVCVCRCVGLKPAFPSQCVPATICGGVYLGLENTARVAPRCVLGLFPGVCWIYFKTHTNALSVIYTLLWHLSEANCYSSRHDSGLETHAHWATYELVLDLHPSPHAQVDSGSVAAERHQRGMAMGAASSHRPMRAL